MTRQVKRAFKYRFYPTPEQAEALFRTFGCVRKVYNMALAARTEAWARQERVNYNQTSAMLTAWKKTEELSFLSEVSSVPLQQTLRHQHTAFGNFFAQRAKYPRYKSRKKSRASAEYTRSAFTWRQGLASEGARELIRYGFEDLGLDRVFAEEGVRVERDLRVPMREVSQADTPSMFGGEKNPPVFVYDCSGPYSDPAAKIDIRSGLPALRDAWIFQRGDVETLRGPSSIYGQERLNDPRLAEMRFNLKRRPRRGKGNVTQMHYARRGEITPEMEFIAIRENQRREQAREAAGGRAWGGAASISLSAGCRRGLRGRAPRAATATAP